LFGERVWRVKMRNREKGSEQEEERKSLLYPVLGWAGERGGRVKMRNRERVYFLWFPDWLVRDVGE
jgi:hypothetical protein